MEEHPKGESKVPDKRKEKDRSTASLPSSVFTRQTDGAGTEKHMNETGRSHSWFNQQPLLSCKTSESDALKPWSCSEKHLVKLSAKDPGCREGSLNANFDWTAT